MQLTYNFLFRSFYSMIYNLEWLHISSKKLKLLEQAEFKNSVVLDVVLSSYGKNWSVPSMLVVG